MSFHFDWHRGSAPRVSFRRRFRPGDIITDGGELCQLQRCPECGGTGVLAAPFSLLDTGGAS